MSALVRIVITCFEEIFILGNIQNISAQDSRDIKFMNALVCAPDAKLPNEIRERSCCFMYKKRQLPQFSVAERVHSADINLSFFLDLSYFVCKHQTRIFPLFDVIL